MEREPSASAGRIRNSMRPYPEAGSHRRVTAKSTINSRPIQYTGNEIPR